MDVKLSAEQESFAAAAGKLAADIAADWDVGRDPSSVRPPSVDDRTWANICDAGWLALRLGADAGGADASCVDACVLAEQLGRHAVPAPVLGPVLVVEQLRLREAPANLLGEIATGQRRVTAALTPDLAGFATDPSEAVAFDAVGATDVVICAEPPVMAPTGPAHVGADLTRTTAEVMEPTTAATPVIGPADAEIRAREAAFALCVVSADLLGAMTAALDAALAHAKVREQFGAPIGSFQAVQHLAAEAYVSVEATRSAVWYAAWAADASPHTDALEAARVTKAYASAAAVEVVEAAVQIFGGIGMTWESPVHVWQRRIHLSRRLFGDEYDQYRLLPPH